MQASSTRPLGPKQILRGILFPLFLIFSNPFVFAGVETYTELVSAIRQVRHASESRIEAAVEQERVREAWETGKLIDEHILLHKERADYGEQVVIKLAKDLGTSETELRYMLQFARTYPIHRTSDELSWGQIQSLLAINDNEKRESMAKKAAAEKWTVDKTREEVRKYKAASQPPSPNVATNPPATQWRALAGDSKKITLPVPGEGSLQRGNAKPGKISVYKVIEKDGKKYYDLGFSTYRRLLGNEPSRFKAGNYVFIKSSGPTYQPSVVREAPEDLYTYTAKVLEVVDGDTFHALIDLGFGISVQNRLRLRSLDAPEILSADGKKAKAALEKALVKNKGRIVIKTGKDPDQHGRYLADVWVKDKSINTELTETGFFTIRGDA